MTFTSCFAPFMEDLVAEKRKAGYGYGHAEWILQKFDEFCVHRRIEEPVVTRELAQDWGTLREMESKVTLAARISALRQLSLYMQSYGIQCYVPKKFSCKSGYIAYVMNPEEIKALFRAFDAAISSAKGRISKRLAMEDSILFRVIFCCGLRVSEARLLRLDTVDLDKGILKLLQSKGAKDRLVYLPEDLRLLCLEYRNVMISRYDIVSEWFFPASNPQKPLQVASLEKHFREAWNRTPYAEFGSSHPTIHSLRHTFVVTRMNEWMRENRDLDSMMPYLSKYLGHTRVDDTFYYYHQVETAFDIVHRKDQSAPFVIPEVEDAF